MIQALRKAALRHKGTSEGVACEGTPVERRTITTRGRAFVYLGVKDAMVKLRESLDEATKLAKKQPKKLKVGAHGWVTGAYDAVSEKTFAKWIGESYRQVPPPLKNPPKKAAKRPAAKKSAKKKKR
jgi:hypothetical protein